MIPNATEQRTAPILNWASPTFGAPFIPRLDQPVQHVFVLDCCSPFFVVPSNPPDTRNALGLA